MAPLKFADYVTTTLKDIPNISVEVVRDHDVLSKEYPLLMAVARASLAGKKKKNPFFCFSFVLYFTSSHEPFTKSFQYIV